MVTKAIIRSINSTGTRCRVRMPLFETASSTSPVEAEALVNITPGLFGNLVVGDVVFVAFEENALEKPIIIGKLFRGASSENSIRGGRGVLDTLTVRTSATIPSSTIFDFPQALKDEYQELVTPKKMADYIKWLEKLLKKHINQLNDHFKCFKSWVQWKLNPNNLEIDDGDLDSGFIATEPHLYQNEGDSCKVCGNKCSRNNTRQYLNVDVNKEYPKI